jgi:hypothetical protein
VEVQSPSAHVVRNDPQPTKWGNAQRWIDTYAGITGESPILEQLYETGVINGVRVWDDLEVYVNDAARMLTVWVTKPMFPWQTQRILRAGSRPARAIRI